MICERITSAQFFPAIVYLLSIKGSSYVFVIAHHVSKGVLKLFIPQTSGNLVPVIFFGYFGTFTLIVLSSNHTIREFALNDKYSKVVNNRYIEYSGIYFQNLGEKPMLFTLNREKMPEEIYIGKFVFEGAEHIKITPVKIRKIYDRGKFIGPSVSEEMSIGY